MKRISMLFFVIFLILQNNINAQFASIKILDPVIFSREISTGQVNNLEIEVTPLGLTTQFDFTYTLSGYNEALLTQNVNYEIVQLFQLPENAFVRDSWLWVEDTIVVAEIMDTWTATSIYEGVVKRRTDPSLLRKYGVTNQNMYELRVYPYNAGKPRRVRISFNVYNNVVSTQNGIEFKTPFPLSSLINAGLTGSVINTKLIINNTKNIRFESLNDFLNNSYTAQEFDSTVVNNQAIYNKTLSYQINQNSGMYNTTLTFIPTFTNGFMYNINTDAKNNEYYYEVLLNLKDIKSQFTTNNYLFVIDYNKDKTSIEYLNFIDVMSNFVKNNFSTKDKFNIINSSSKEITKFSNEWLSINNENFENAKLWLQTISPKYNYTIENALDTVAQFFEEQKSNGVVITFSTSDHLGASSNSAIQSISAKFRLNKVVFNCVSFANSNVATYSIGGKTFFANEYFFSNIATLTRGNYKNAMNINELATQSASILSSISGELSEANLTINSENALAYQKRDLSKNIDKTNMFYAETGKIFGEFPFQFKYLGILNDKIVSATSNFINETDSVDYFTPVYQLWKSSEIRRLESLNLNTKEHNWSIVDNSLDSRVLSKFTAFLALEPWMMKDKNPYIKDETKEETTSIGELEINDAVKVEIFPNPMITKSKLLIHTDLDFINEKFEIELVDLTGRLIKSYGYMYVNNEFEIENKDNEGNKIASGQYILIFKSKYGNLSKTIIIQ